jgi:hypothetical protein
MWRLLPWWALALVGTGALLSLAYYAAIFIAVGRRWRQLD